VFEPNSLKLAYPLTALPLVATDGVPDGTAGNASNMSFSNNGEGSVDESDETDIHEVGRSLVSDIPGMFIDP
jgi:hypothetical protein